MLPAKLSLLMTNSSSPHAAAASYLGSLSRSVRRDEGRVYTPTSLVDFILDLSEYTADAPIETLRLLDPACGGGAFLLGAVDRLAVRMASQIDDVITPKGSSALQSAVEGNLFGIDKDPIACDLAREAMRRHVATLTGRQVSPNFFASNVICADFLLTNSRILPIEQLDRVVGNPPYVATTRLSEEQKADLRSRFIVANGRLDLYTLFFEKGLRLLRPGGMLAFITPNKFLVSESSKRLRTLMLSCASIHTIANFRSHRVFEDAATVPCVTVLRREATASAFRLMECTVAPGGQGPVHVIETSSPTHPKSGGQPWFLAQPELLALAHHLQEQHPSLGELASRISAGIATGRDRVFVLRDGAGCNLEPELRRPALRGQDLLAFRIQDPSLELILPYLPTSSGRPELVDLREFPRTGAYLERHRAELETRHCVRVWQKAWYDIHDPWTLDITGLTKVLVPDVACTNRFVLDEGRFCPLHSAYYIVPDGVDPRYLTAVLNSSPVEFLVRLLAPVVKDGFSRYRRQFLVTLPIPAARGHEGAEIVRAAEAVEYETADALCCRLFGLTERKLRTMRGFLDRAREVHGRYTATEAFT
jgi:SAM-dependent methyltransferase